MDWSSKPTASSWSLDSSGIAMPQAQDVSGLSEEGLNNSEQRALIAVLLGVALATLDTATANTALPTTAADLHSPAAASEHIPPFARLLTHVFGEHLGQWRRGIDLLESMRRLPAFDGRAATAGALTR